MAITKYKLCDEELAIYNEDDAAPEGGRGYAGLIQRQDTLASSTSADGDWGWFKATSKGELYVKATDTDALLTTIDADTSSMATDLGTIDTNIAALTKVEDTAAGDGYSGVAILATRQDTLSSLVDTDGDFAGLKVDSLGRLWVNAEINGEDADDDPSTANPLFVGGLSADQGSALGTVSAADDRAALLMDLYRRVFVNDSNNVGWQVSAITAGTTSAQMDATPLAGRKTAIVQNQSDKSVWVKNTTAVADNTSIEIPCGASMEFDWGESLPIHIIGEEAGQTVAFMEAG